MGKMKQTLFLLCALLLCSAVTINAQVRVGGKTKANPAAVLDLNSTNDSVPADNKGALALPRVELTSTTMVLNTATPVNGMLVYNMKGALDPGIYYWDGKKWLYLTDAPKTSQQYVEPLITWIPVKFSAGRAVIPGGTPYNTTCTLVTDNWARAVTTVTSIDNHRGVWTFPTRESGTGCIPPEDPRPCVNKVSDSLYLVDYAMNVVGSYTVPFNVTSTTRTVDIARSSMWIPFLCF